ncbi:hypothetical protein G1H11_14715 [Phytoactinopolyspora alkaliphila]|uniref:Uncharacterized protein n=1 Tax=Phytoactinopolyspora alkaliphila TaxID=1783498 RepID=A0A6N9YNQ2_9ACTN|nr:hypothetical protein [Phytoactinopolyspora alkaliphila]NED96560.1 hypothetical protein [Phytoactinopolyspora alkaliphila]
MTAHDEYRDAAAGTDEPRSGVEYDEPRGGGDIGEPRHAGVDGDGPLLLGDSTDLVSRWDHAQSTFVDDPRLAVQEARDLVEDVLGKLASSFDEERGRLEATWEAGGEPTTEDLRQALRRYRLFFERLLAA